MMFGLKWLLAQFLDGLTGLRNWAYSCGLLDQVRARAPVISVGNLTMGGTGKTPMILLLAKHFSSQGKKVAVVSKNYQAEVNIFTKVRLHTRFGAQFYGDEPWLIASQLPEVAVFVGPRKTMASSLRDFDLILLDDGFQHRDLHRDFDLVLVDGSRPFTELELFPLGRGRESIEGLQRAQAVVLTKAENLSPEEKEKWSALLRESFSGPLYFANFHMELPELSGKRVLAISGIGNAESFERPLRAGTIEFSALRFKDHHRYTSRDFREIEEKGKAFDLVLTTEKDLVKLQEGVSLPQLQAVPLKIEIQDPDHQFFAMMDGVFK